MRDQSTRAEITAWSFDNEYTYGDFHGNAREMMRRGYDFHLHYANFGTRTLLIRLPHGFPNPSQAKPYLMRDAICFLKDKRGGGGTLSIQPCYEPDQLDDALLPLRAEILDGDLRPLYLARLAAACDSDNGR